MRSFVRVVCVLGCASLILSCGGSGGGGGPFVFTPALLAGDYHLIVLAGEDGPPESAITTWGPSQSDGVSRIDFGTVGQNEDSVVSSTTPPFPYSYAVTGDGGLTMTLITATFAGGGLTRSGNAAALGTILTTATRSNAIYFLKKGAGLASATLTGAYHLGFLGLDGPGSTYTGTIGTTTFDGTGGGTLDPDVVNVNGAFPVILAPPPTITYAVGADGTLTTAGTLSLHGGVLPGGDFAIASGSTVNGQKPGGFVLVRQQSFATAASLQGTYTFVGLGYNLALGTIESVAGTFTADGAGNYTLTATFHRPATGVSTLGPTTGTYTVAPSGIVSVDAGGFTIQGAVSLGGEFAFLGGGTTVGSNPQLYVLLRR